MQPYRLVIATVICAASSLVLAGCGASGDDDTGPGTDSVVGTECISSAQCDDQIACTVDKCDRGFCSNTEMKCDDGDPCTDDSCVGGECVFDPREGCCDDDADCDDGDPCTKGDRCDKSKMTCVIAEPLNPCCRSDKDCDDSDVCTVDTCQTNLLCSNVWSRDARPGVCCSADLDCADSDACTRDKCVIHDSTTSPPHGTCHFEVLCCDSDKDCSDGESPCMAGVCEFESGSTTGECGYEWIPGCCVTLDDCERTPCMNATCVDQECGWDRIPGCCTADVECGDECLYCKKGESDEGVCELKGTAGCCLTNVWFEDFSDLGGFDVTGFDEPGYADLPQWHVSSLRYFSAPSALLFGNPDTGFCRSADGLKTGGRAVSPSIPLMMTREPVLSFRMYKNTDETSRFNDVLSVWVLSAYGKKKVFSTSELSVFNTCGGGECAFVEFPTTPLSLSEWAGQSISIVFEYDSNSTLDAEYQGVWIDDVSVSGECD